MTVDPGDSEIRIRAVELTGGELFRPQFLRLIPVKDP